MSVVAAQDKVALVATEPQAETYVEPSTETVVENKEETPAIEDIAATTVVEPLQDESDKQPTLTHAEAGTSQTDAEPATNVEGVQAEEPTEELVAAESSSHIKKDEVKEETKEKKEEKKVATKEKVEKTKSEGKGFFAKFFGGNKSPKKEKKVKTPRTEKVDPVAEPIAAAHTQPAPVQETTETAPATESVPIAEAAKVIEAITPEATPVMEAGPSDDVPVTGSAIVPSASTSSVIAPVESKFLEASTEPEVLKESESVPAIAPTETPAEAQVDEAVPAAKEEAPKPPKANRRLSARFTGFVKNFGKKDGSSTPKEEKSREAAEAFVEPMAVSSEAPKLEQPIETEPLKMEERTSAPPAGPIVPAAA